MIIDQGELLRETTMIFVKEFMAIGVRESYEKGDFLFYEGDPATHFYTLIQGNIKLTTGKTEQKVYNIIHAGEAFGWSSLVERETYSASAECMEPTTLLRIENKKILNLLKKHPDSGIFFYKNLAMTLGNRLLTSYKIISEVSETLT